MSTSFQLVKKALDRLFALVKEDHGAKTDALLKEEIATDRYGNLLDPKRKPIDYSNPATRFAYVYSYVAAHSSYVRGLLRQSDDLLTLMKADEKLSVACLGGGPGSELMGLIQVCVDLHRKGPLACWLIDSEDGWSETWSHVDDDLSAAFKINNYFRKIDVTAVPNVKNLKELFASDVFILSYFLSEIYSFKDKAKPFFDALSASMKKGALVVYLDNSTPKFTALAEEIFPSEDFELIYTADNVRALPGMQEQKIDLGAYLNKGWRVPKIQAYVTQRIWKKK